MAKKAIKAKKPTKVTKAKKKFAQKSVKKSVKKSAKKSDKKSRKPVSRPAAVSMSAINKKKSGGSENPAPTVGINVTGMRPGDHKRLKVALSDPELLKVMDSLDPGLREQVSGVVDGFAQYHEFREREKDLKKVSGQIVVYPHLSSYIKFAEKSKKGPGGGYLNREEMPGIHSTLMYDFPDSRIGIIPENLKLWKTSYDELFRIGIDNIKKMSAIKPTEGPTIGGNRVFFIAEEGFEYLASYAFVLSEIKGMVGPKGSLVALPLYDLIFAHPIGEKCVDPAVAADLAETAQGIYNIRKNHLSPDIFWFHDGKYKKLLIDKKGKPVLPAAIKSQN